ncbi:MAG: hypothetical protein U0Y68_17400 [Blastocatellia bacterium]
MPRKLLLSILVLFLSSFPSLRAPLQTPQIRQQDVLIQLSSRRQTWRGRDKTTTLTTEEVVVPLETPTPLLAVGVRIEEQRPPAVILPHRPKCSVE